MARQVLVVTLLGALAAAGALALTPARPVAACSLAVVTLEEIAERAELVIVGEVVSEQPVGPDVPDVYTSTVSVTATLKGGPEREFTFDRLGHLFEDCSGGPRLATGERVLLFLYNLRGRLQVSGYEQGKYTLAGGEARTAEAAPLPVEDFLQRVAAITDAAPDQLDNAIAFANGEPAPAPTASVEAAPALPEADDGPSALLIGLSVAVAAVLLAALLFAVRRLRRVS